MNTNIGDYFQKVNVPSPEPPKQRRKFSANMHKRLRRAKHWVNGHRLVAGLLAFMMLAAAVLPAGYSVLQQRKYMVSSETSTVIGNTSDDLAKKLVYDDSKQAYVFNKEHMPFDIPGSATDKQAADQVAAVRMLQSKAKQQDLSAKVGGGSAKDEQLYSSLFPKDFAQGATYYDNQAQLSFSLVPKFTALSGDLVGNRLVYPLKDLPGQAIYTVKSDGVKEDVVLQKYAGDTVTLEYTLAIPKTMEAKLLDSGSIGIYSADPSIYGSSVQDASKEVEAVIKAQETAPKTHLAFVVPAPHVTEADGSSEGVYSKFVLKGKDVAVVTTGLSKSAYPLSIDPSVVVANSASFATGNNESNSSISASSVQRQAVTGGDLDTWNYTTSFSDGRRYAATATFNNYVYMVGGFNDINGAIPDVEYATLNTDGTTGTWASANDLPDERSGAAAVAYDGYLYSIGGSYAASSAFGDVFVAAINSNGSLGSWSSTTSLGTAVRFHAAAAYKGFMYAWGGATGNNNNTAVTTVQYAPINANGTLGNWSTTSSFATARSQLMGVIYNGFIYAIGGLNTSSVTQASVQSAPINSNGSVGTWIANTSLLLGHRATNAVVYGGFVYLSGGVQAANTNITRYAALLADGTLSKWETATTVFTNGRSSPTVAAANGYLYVMGGENAGGGTFYNTTESAKIRDAGVLGAIVRTSSSATSARERHAMTQYNGYVYVIGGYGSGSNLYVNYVQYAPIEASGDITSTGWAAANGTNITTSRADLAAVAYNGYLYNFGGYNGSTYYATAQYSAINASTGANGAWTNTTSLPTARGGISAVAYNGYMYVAGGADSGGNLNEIRYAVINSNGSLGTWNTTTTLSSAANRMRIAEYNGYMYVVGGTTASLPAVANGATGTRASGTGATTVTYAKINSNGTLGTMTSTTALSSGRHEFGFNAYNGYLYASGGFNGTTVLTTTEVAKLNADGSVGTWQLGMTMPANEFNMGSTTTVAFNGYLYFCGGRSTHGIDNPTRASLCLYAPIYNGGRATMGAWSTSGNSLPAGRSYAASVYLNGYAYVIGGSGVNSYVYAALSKDGTVGTWSSAQTFPTTLTGASAVTYKGYIYVIGGNTTSVYYAKPNANGSISSWSTGSSLPAAVQYGGATQVNGYIYMVGGALSSTSQTAVYYAQIMPDNSVGTWQTNGNALPNARHYHSVVSANGYVYAIGGYDGTSYQTTTYYAKTNTDGSLGEWSAAGHQLPVALYGAVAIIVNGTIYMTGGASSTTAYMTSISHDGAISPWRTPALAAALPATKTYASGVYANGYLYNFGGNATTTVYYSALNTMPRIAEYSKVIDLGTNSSIQSIRSSSENADGLNLTYASAPNSGVFGTPSSVGSTAYTGTIDSWGSTNNLSITSNSHGATIINGYMYVIRNGSASSMYAKLNSDGTTGTWATTTSIPAKRGFAGVVSSNGYIYVIGGRDPDVGNAAQTTAYYAKPNSNGTISSWNTTTALPLGRKVASTVVANGYVYVMGGNDDVGYKDTTYYAKLNSDGTLGSWNTTAVLPVAFGYSTAVTNDGYIYIMAGIVAGTTTLHDAVYYASINSNGTLGSWNTATSLPAVSRSGASVVAGGYLYYMGGSASSSAGSQVATVYSAKLNSNGSVGSWNTLSQSLPTASGEAIALYANGYLYYIGGLNTSSVSMATVYAAKIRSSLTSISDNTRYLRAFATIDDGLVNGSYPETLFGSFTGMYITYKIVAPPTNRLFGGKSFENNILQPLIQPGTNPEN